MSTRNEGSADLGGRIWRVVKSLQNLSNNHKYQYTQMVNAPAGGQAGAARRCHRAKCFGFAARLCRGLPKGPCTYLPSREHRKTPVPRP